MTLEVLVLSLVAVATGLAAPFVGLPPAVVVRVLHDARGVA